MTTGIAVLTAAICILIKIYFSYREHKKAFTAQNNDVILDLRNDKPNITEDAEYEIVNPPLLLTHSNTGITDCDAHTPSDETEAAETKFYQL